jgi:hypothetical protein
MRGGSAAQATGGRRAAKTKKKRLKNRALRKEFKPPQLQASKGGHHDEHDQGARAKKQDECEENISDFVDVIAEFLR